MVATTANAVSVMCAFIMIMANITAVEVAMLVDDYDLDVFISRPDIRSPKLQVHFDRPELSSPGYWFVAPYSSLEDTYQATLYQPAQTGPHIYDNQGNLVWSGAHLIDPGRPALDFKAVAIDGTQHLSFLVLPRKRSSFHPEGVGLILDPTLTIRHELKSRVGSGVENMHEFNVIDDGRRALMLTFQEHAETVQLPGMREPLFLSVGNYGFVELNVSTGGVLFEWWSQGRINVEESSTTVPWVATRPWDWLHLNSIDKDDRGDYLLSARFTDTIYKISSVDGSIMWRLGGKFSSFEMVGFNFSGQHDARFCHHKVRHQGDKSLECISLMDNAGGGSVRTSNHSMGLIIELDTLEMKATLVRAFHRPDRAMTVARGNFQILPSTNVIAGWSENAFATEFTSKGLQILSTNFTSRRFATYRMYKSNFTSWPIDNPTLKATLYGQTPASSTIAIYVSWNGATEVYSWKFFAAHDQSSEFTTIGAATKNGFETVFMASGYWEKTYAEAIGNNGTVLGRSPSEAVILPPGWRPISESRSFVGATVLHETNPPTFPSAIGSSPWNKIVEAHHQAVTGISVGPLSVFVLLFIILVALAARSILRRTTLLHVPLRRISR